MEHRALGVLDALEAGGALPPLCFASLRLPAVTAGARWLAGVANSARGREALWLVGAGPGKKRRSTEVAEVRQWLTRAEAVFDLPSPEWEVLPLEIGGARLALVSIRTTRAPFTLRARGARPGEVPWFEATSGKVRSATRLDLIRLVTPLGELPQIEVLEAELIFFRNTQPRSRTTYRWTLDASIYLLPKGGERLIIPLHKVRADLSIGDWRCRAAELHVTADRQSPALRVTESALLADGLGRFFLYCAGATEVESLDWATSARLIAEFLPAGAEICALAQGELQPETALEPNQAGRWKSA